MGPEPVLVSGLSCVDAESVCSEGKPSETGWSPAACSVVRWDVAATFFGYRFRYRSGYRFGAG